MLTYYQVYTRWAFDRDVFEVFIGRYQLEYEEDGMQRKIARHWLTQEGWVEAIEGTSAIPVLDVPGIQMLFDMDTLAKRLEKDVVGTIAYHMPYLEMIEPFTRIESSYHSQEIGSVEHA